MSSTTAPARRHRLRAGAIASIAAVVGLVVGGLAFTSTPSGALSGWTTATLENDLVAVSGPDYFAPGYAVDDEGFVHLRGIVGGVEVPMERSSGGGGPWVVTAFTLPCELSPEKIVGQTINVNDINGGLIAFHGVILVEPDGEVRVGAFDIPTLSVGSDDLAQGFAAALDSITFQADDGDCPPEETTTTEAP